MMARPPECARAVVPRGEPLVGVVGAYQFTVCYSPDSMKCLFSMEKGRGRLESYPSQKIVALNDLDLVAVSDAGYDNTTVSLYDPYNVVPETKEEGDELGKGCFEEDLLKKSCFVGTLDVRKQYSICGLGYMPRKDSLSGRCLIIAGNCDHFVSVSDVETRKVVLKFNALCTPLRTYCVRTMPNGQAFVAGDDSSEIQLFDLSREIPLSSFKAHRKTVHGMDHKPDCSVMVSCGNDAMAYVWDLRRSGRDPVLRMKLNSSGRSVLHAGDINATFIGMHDSTVGVWDVRGGTLLETLSVGGGDYSVGVNEIVRLADSSFVSCARTVVKWRKDGKILGSGKFKQKHTGLCCLNAHSDMCWTDSKDAEERFGFLVGLLNGEFACYCDRLSVGSEVSVPRSLFASSTFGSR